MSGDEQWSPARVGGTLSLRARSLDVVERVTRLAEVALSPGAVGAARRSRPFSVAAFRLARTLADAAVDPELVLDVGANRGQFAAAALHRWPTARVISFEPLEGPAASLRAISDPRSTVHQVALGRRDATIDIYQHEYSPSSSVLPSIDPQATAASVRSVPQRTLDGALGTTVLGPGPVLLKLDVQGYELEVLAGAATTLAAVDALVIEQAFIATYDGQPLFQDVHEELARLGFSLDRPIDWRRVAGQVLEIDCLYRRR